MHQSWRIFVTIVILFSSSPSFGQSSISAQRNKQTPIQYNQHKHNAAELILNPHLNPPRPRSKWRYLGYALAPLWIWGSAFPSAMMATWMSNPFASVASGETAPPNMCLGHWNFGPGSEGTYSPPKTYCSMYKSSAVVPWLYSTMFTLAPYNIAMGYASGTNGNVWISTILPTLSYVLFTKVIQTRTRNDNCQGRDQCAWSYTLQFVPVIATSYVGAYLWELTHEPGKSITTKTALPYLSPVNGGAQVGLVMRF